MRRTVRSALGILLILASLLDACSERTPEQDKIKAVVTAVQKAAEDKDTKGVLAHLSKTYLDTSGNDYQGIKGILVYYFFRHQKVRAIITGLDVSLDGNAATARFEAILSGSTAGQTQIIPEALGAYRFEVSLEKEGDAWMVKSAKWEQIGEGPQ